MIASEGLSQEGGGKGGTSASTEATNCRSPEAIGGGDVIHKGGGRLVKMAVWQGGCGRCRVVHTIKDGRVLPGHVVISKTIVDTQRSVHFAIRSS